MIRIADIISGSGDEDKSKRDKNKEEEKELTPPPNIELIKRKSQEPSSQEPSSTKAPPSEAKKDEEGQPSLMELSKSMLDSVKLEGPKESKALYNGLLTSLKDICKNLKLEQDIDLSAINNNLSAVIDQIALGNKEFLLMSNVPYEDEYLYPHLVNVALLSIVVASQLGFNKTRLLELGLGALLHDVGLLQFEQLIYAPRKVTKEEYEQIKQHPILGSKLLEARKGISKQMLSIVGKHHERRDGSGYPNGLRLEEIEDEAQIVCLVNTYESLTHKRPFRDRVLNEGVLRLMVKGKKAFNVRFLKLFIEAISIYPLSSWVKLSSGEIAQVIAINKSSLLKPSVKIYFDKEGARLELGKEKIIDLSKQPNIYVKEQLLDETIESKLEG